MRCPLKSMSTWSRTVIVCCTAVAFASGVRTSAAQEGVRYFEKDGLMYRETTIKIRHPVQEMKYKEVTETINRDEYLTELKPYVRNAYVPVTTYGWQPEMYGKWNPFGQPHVAYRPVPKVSWSVQPQTVQVPVTRRVTTPEKRTRKVPQTSLKYVEREYVQTIPVGPARTHGANVTGQRLNTSQRSNTGQRPNAAPAANRGAANGGAANRVASRVGNASGLEPIYRPPTQQSPPREQFGGVARLEADPPRVGFSTRN